LHRFIEPISFTGRSGFFLEVFAEILEPVDGAGFTEHCVLKLLEVYSIHQMSFDFGKRIDGAFILLLIFPWQLYRL